MQQPCTGTMFHVYTGRQLRTSINIHFCCWFCSNPPPRSPCHPALLVACPMCNVDNVEVFSYHVMGLLSAKTSIDWPTVSNIFAYQSSCSWSVLSTRKSISRCLLWILWILNWCINWRTTTIWMCLPRQSPQTNCTISRSRCPGCEMFQIFDSGLTQLTPAAHYSGSDASRGRHAGHAPRPRRVPGHDPAGDTCAWDGPLDSAFSNNATFQVAVGNVGIKTSIN